MNTVKRLVVRYRGGIERMGALSPNRHRAIRILAWPPLPRRTERKPSTDSRPFVKFSRRKKSEKFLLRSEGSARILQKLFVMNENHECRPTDRKDSKNQPLTEDPETVKELWTDQPRQPSNKVWFARNKRTVSESVPRPS
jgi:hypothetical protein